MRELPPLIELRAFEAVARWLSFKRAAEELGVTPTALSHQIRLLELHCGQSLFRRRPRPLKLTPAGEQLFPVIRGGLDQFAEALAVVRGGGAFSRLRITATNAFCARWLLPRLTNWRSVHPDVRLVIVGTDNVLDLQSGEVDVAIRYALEPPSDGPYVELLRDVFHVVASPSLVGASPGMLSPEEIARLPLIEADWPPDDSHAPNWNRWQSAARAHHEKVPELPALPALHFREELHAIEAVIAGQGIAICSDVLVGPELARGTLVSLSPITLSGYGFYIVHRAEHPRTNSLRAFIAWARSVC